MIDLAPKIFSLFVLLVAWSGTTHFELLAQTETTKPTLPPGAMVKARLIEGLNSSRADKDDRFSLHILFATQEGKRIPLPRGTRISGQVLAAKSALRERAGLLTLKVDQLIFPNEKTEPLFGEIQLLPVKDVTTESNGPQLTLRGSIDESTTMTIQSSTSNTPPPANVDDLSHGDLKSSDKKQNSSRSSIELRRKKGHDLDLSAGTIFNIKILEAPAPVVPAKPASNPSPNKTERLRQVLSIMSQQQPSFSGANLYPRRSVPQTIFLIRTPLKTLENIEPPIVGAGPPRRIAPTARITTLFFVLLYFAFVLV